MLRKMSKKRREELKKKYEVKELTKSQKAWFISFLIVLPIIGFKLLLLLFKYCMTYSCF